MPLKDSGPLQLPIQRGRHSELPGKRSPNLHRFSRPSEQITCPIPRQRLDEKRQTQVLARSCLNGKLQQRCLRLISKISKAHGTIPSSYTLQQEFIRVGKVHRHGGFADVSGGEYLGRPVAIKCLKMNEGESDRAFRVRLVNPVAIVIVHISPSDYAERSSIGNICPIRTSYLC